MKFQDTKAAGEMGKGVKLGWMIPRTVAAAMLLGKWGVYFSGEKCSICSKIYIRKAEIK